MPERNSLDKIVNAYFAGVCRSPISYGGKTYSPKNLVVSPLLFRGFTCPEHCGGCCPRFSLDYIPGEAQPYEIEPRWVELNGKKFAVFSDMQLDHENHHCRNLIHENGRCGIHGKQPFSCDFELVRFIHQEKRVILTQRLFGRGWAFLRTDGERGARCEMLPPTKETIADAIRKLKRLKQWCEYFEVNHCLDSIIQWAERGYFGGGFLIPADKKKGIIIRNLLTDDDEEPLVQIGG